MSQMTRVMELLDTIQCTALGREFKIIPKYDPRSLPDPEPRIFLQIKYSSPCSKGGTDEVWKGRKWYLSDYMTDDEIIKTCYLAFRTCVEHEILEGFRVEGKTIFNPHIDYKELIKIADREVTREKELV